MSVGIFFIFFRVIKFMVLVPLTVSYPCANIPRYFHIDYNHMSHKYQYLIISSYLVIIFPVFCFTNPEYVHSL